MPISFLVIFMPFLGEDSFFDILENHFPYLFNLSILISECSPISFFPGDPYEKSHKESPHYVKNKAFIPSFSPDFNCMPEALVVPICLLKEGRKFFPQGLSDKEVIQ